MDNIDFFETLTQPKGLLIGVTFFILLMPLFVFGQTHNYEAVTISENTIIIEEDDLVMVWKLLTHDQAADNLKRFESNYNYVYFLDQNESAGFNTNQNPQVAEIVGEIEEGTYKAASLLFIEDNVTVVSCILYYGHEFSFAVIFSNAAYENSYNLKNNKKSYITAFNKNWDLLSVSTLPYSQERLEKRQSYQELGFSFCLPASFQNLNNKGEILLFYDWDYEGFVPVISIGKDNYEKPLNEYFTDVFSQWESFYDHLEILDKSIFITNNGIPGNRYIILIELWSKKMKQVNYFFSLGKKVLLISVTIPPDCEQEYIQLIDECAGTFQWEETTTPP